MTKTILLLQATSENNPEKVKLLLKANHFAKVTGDMLREDAFISTDIKNVFDGAEVKNVTWRWPSGRAFRNLQGVDGLGLLHILMKRGIPVDLLTDYENAQVPDGAEQDPLWVGRYNHLELKINVSDKKYQELKNKYGELETF